MPRLTAGNRFTVRDSGTCLKFTGASDAVQTPSGVNSNITTAFTLAAWVKKTGPNTVRGNIFRSSSADHLWFNFQATGKLRLYLSEGSNPSTESTNIVNPGLNYHFYVATWDGSTVNLYMDNTLVGTQAVTGTINFAGGHLRVGGGASTEPVFSFIDEPTVWSRALTATELTNLYYGNRIPTSGLIARYLFDEGSGTSATDSSGNSNTGTISGATYSTEKRFLTRTVAPARFPTQAQVTDTFTRSDSTTTLGTTETGGKTWSSFLATYGISTNRAYPVADATNSPMYVDVSSPNVDVQVTISTFSGSQEEALYFRIADATNHWRFIRVGADLRLQRTTAGSTTSVFDVSKTFSNGDIFRVRAHGDNITCFINDILQFVTTSSTHNTATKHGFGQSAGHSGARFDDFSVKVGI